jgi:phosphotransferase system IIB component
MDHDVAGIKANGVSGVFSVNNQLQVQSQRAEK